MSRTTRLDPDRLAALEEQRDFLLRSLEDLEREHDAGDMTDDDYAELKDDYTARAADVLRALAAQEAAFAEAKHPRSTARTAVWAVGVAVFALVAGVVAAQAMGARKPGESASGGISVVASPTQRANECSQKLGSAPEEAAACFEEILDEDPDNAVALTWSAWQLSLYSPSLPEPQRTVFQTEAANRLEAAVASNPRYSYARAFRAVVAYRNGRYEDAARFLEEFEENDPSTQAAQVIEQMDLKAKIADGLAGGGPAGEAGSTTTTVAGSTTPGG